MKGLTSFKSIPHLLDHFKDEETCKKFLEIQRWGNKVTCPHCDHDKVYRTSRGFKCASPECYKKFTVTVGTVFESSKIPLRIWYCAVWLIANHKKGVSSVQLALDLNITQKTAWFMAHRIREMLAPDSDKLEGIIEMDEAYFSNGSKGSKLLKENSSKVVAMRERGGRLKAYKVNRLQAYELNSLVFNHIERGSTLVTDGTNRYAMVKQHVNHVQVNHSKKVWTSGIYHTNGVEGFWHHLKLSIKGIHHFVSPKHLQRYVNAMAYRWTTKDMDLGERLTEVVQLSKGKRLRYADLIKPVSLEHE